MKGFPESFQTYDPLAKAVPGYGQLYLFIETALGLMSLMRFEINIAMIARLIVGNNNIWCCQNIVGQEINSMYMPRCGFKTTYEQSNIYRK